MEDNKSIYVASVEVGSILWSRHAITLEIYLYFFVFASYSLTRDGSWS